MRVAITTAHSLLPQDSEQQNVCLHSLIPSDPIYRLPTVCPKSWVAARTGQKRCLLTGQQTVDTGTEANKTSIYTTHSALTDGYSSVGDG